MENLYGIIFKWRECQFQYRIWNGKLLKHVLLICFMLNKHNLLNFSWHVIRGFYCAWIVKTQAHNDSIRSRCCNGYSQFYMCLYWHNTFVWNAVLNRSKYIFQEFGFMHDETDMPSLRFFRDFLLLVRQMPGYIMQNRGMARTSLPQAWRLHPHAWQ